jgi:phosphoribosylglycinamide formyltransferase-1
MIGSVLVGDNQRTGLAGHISYATLRARHGTDHPGQLATNVLGSPRESSSRTVRVCRREGHRVRSLHPDRRTDRRWKSGIPEMRSVVTERPGSHRTARLLVLVSGSGTNLQALLDASADPSYGAQVVAAGADRDGTAGLTRAADRGVPTFVTRVKDHASRERWDAALTEACARHAPDLIVSAGFLKLVGPAFLAEFGGRYVNTHNALLPAFPGIHGPRDALAYGVKITGATLHFVDGGVDTGPIIAQVPVPLLDDDDETSLTERIKEAERRQLVSYVGRMVREGWTVTGRKVTIP